MWGCTGEIAIEQFRRIIISMWALLAGRKQIKYYFCFFFLVSGILVLADAIMLPFIDGVSVGTYIFKTAGTVVLGMIACGFGTSIYSTENNDSADMIVKRALFSMTILFFLFIDSISISFSLIIAVFFFDPIFLALNLPLLAILLVVFVLALFILIKQVL